MLVRGNYRKIPAIVLKLCIPYAGFPLLNPVEFSVFLLCHIILILVDLNIVPFLDFSRQKVGAEADPTNFLLMHAMGPNVAGVIGTAVAAGTFMAIFGV